MIEMCCTFDAIMAMDMSGLIDTVAIVQLT